MLRHSSKREQNRSVQSSNLRGYSTAFWAVVVYYVAKAGLEVIDEIAVSNTASHIGLDHDPPKRLG